ncbi:MAG: dephospho-CoA kinase [Planctomycetes bacterium]|nr:dephospho-CoA kinase [Planctomycetota bacterium]
MPAERSEAAAHPRPALSPRSVVIGLVGGIAAGKTAVAQAFAAHGFEPVDADRLARAVTADAGVLGELAAALGPDVVRDGALDRAAVAERVFRDPAARARLEAITHPRIRVRILQALTTARAHDRPALLDAPLLFEVGLEVFCDHVVFVHASDAVRRSRAAGRGWAPEELARREAAQLPLAAKRARADSTIDNDGDLGTMQAQVAAVLATLRERA